MSCVSPSGASRASSPEKRGVSGPKRQTRPLNPQTLTTPALWSDAGDAAVHPQIRENREKHATAAFRAAQSSKRCIMRAKWTRSSRHEDTISRRCCSCQAAQAGGLRPTRPSRDRSWLGRGPESRAGGRPQAANVNVRTDALETEYAYGRIGEASYRALRVYGALLERTCACPGSGGRWSEVIE